ncbi:DUF1576 domain-containing protein [Alkalibacter saccharofermentans]|uniref:DUF1576 domain-containing protein n=1 Tax=Alkalibacter saccharofermentans DSM 14828 TaxID=1120975 RepID=A0A1M4XQ65_9FIRM|nr:DUF1576 domain-containing protein [Alkalibacter saccharofermentans]SHE95727.1 Protein of unknown function [Alkalibacter saccharofermentans DSM 14828]
MEFKDKLMQDGEAVLENSAIESREKILIEEEVLYINNVIVTDKLKYMVMAMMTLFLLISSLVFNTPSEIMSGMKLIIVSPSTLVTDYFEIANIGSSLFNSAIITMVGIIVARVNKVEMNGPMIAALLTLAGFSFFGKNLYNTWGIMAGVYTYSVFKKESFDKYIVQALFSTALGPLISCITFGIELNLIQGILLGNLAGFMAGFVLPPLASHFLLFHQGYSIYNIGFTAGIIGMFFMAALRGLGFQTETAVHVLSGMNEPLSMFLIIMFSMMLFIGLFLNQFSFKGLSDLFKLSGRLSSDFVSQVGFGIVLINMSLLGFLSMFYVILLGGDLNGPVIGGIFTVVGFGAYGKHLRNVVPILLGVYIASLFNVYDTASTVALLAALFGTTLAPIAGHYGPIHGIIAGFLHMSMTMNVSYLHGGMNLYNNGFSGGFVAAALAPLFESVGFLKNRADNYENLYK